MLPALHPSWKLEYARVKWDGKAFDDGVKALEKAVRINLLTVPQYITCTHTDSIFSLTVMPRTIKLNKPRRHRIRVAPQVCIQFSRLFSASSHSDLQPHPQHRRWYRPMHGWPPQSVNALYDR